MAMWFSCGETSGRGGADLFFFVFSNVDCSLCKNMHLVVPSFFTDISVTLIYKSDGSVLTKVHDCQGLKETGSQNFILRILVLFHCA